MRTIIETLYNYFEKHPITLRVILFSLLGAMAFCISRVHFEEDISTFLPQNEENRRINYAFQHIGAANKIIVFIAAKDTTEPDYKEKLILAAEQLNDELRKNDTTQLITELFYKVDNDNILEMMHFILQNMPYYLDEEAYLRMDSLCASDAIRGQLAFDRDMLFSPAGGFMKEMIGEDPLHFSYPIFQKLQEIQAYNNYTIHNGYLFNKEGNELMMTIASNTSASETAINKKWVANIESSSKRVMEQFDQQVEISSIGAAIISIGNSDRIKIDALVSTAIALLLILVLLMLFYKDIRALLIILISITFGALFGLAFLILLKDSISIIAIGIGSIIVGIAVNYPLHFLAHYQQGYTKKETIRDIIEPLVTGNLTTVGAFLSLLFISSDALRDTGLFSAMLLIGTILFVLIFLPHLFRKGLFKNQERSSEKMLFGRIANFNLEKNKVAVCLILLLTIPLYFLSRHTTFETDLNTINYMSDEHKEKLEKLLTETESGLPGIYCVSEGETMEIALQNHEIAAATIDSLLRDSLIVNRAGISIFLPSQQLQAERISRWNSFWETHRDNLKETMGKIGTEIGFSEEAFSPFYEIIENQYQTQGIEHFDPIVSSFANNYLSQASDKAMVFTLMETTPEQLGRVQQILNQQGDNIFAFDNRSILSKMVDALSADFDFVLYICGIIVFLFLTLSFGRLELSTISFIPLTVSWIWILGLMNLFDMKFNIVNIILATFIFGQGDDYTIFVTEGLMYEYTYRKKMLASYKNSVMLSATIMFIGIGALIVAQHPAMRSLAEVTIVGMFSVLLMAYLFPPLLFKWLTTSKGENRLMPITFKNLGLTIISFLFFFVCTILLSIMAVVLLLLGIKSPKCKLMFHQCVQKSLLLCAKLIPQIPFHIHNPNGDDSFSTPCVITCNHQSHLDLMYTLMLHPKIVCLTNKWVWNCPFYGWIIRYADCLPVKDGVDSLVPRLQKLVDQGYSILIFPEGTRSETCEILPFHQGAVHLANLLGVDILPIVTHGIGHAFPKKEFLLRKGKVDIQILDRISPNNPIRNEKSERESTKELRRLYQEAYRKMRDQYETPDYFADLVYHNYIYKGREIAKECRENLRNHQNYRKEIEALPDHGEVRIEACGQGEFALLAALVKRDLQIIATDSSDEKISIAANCISVPANLRYETTESDKTD